MASTSIQSADSIIPSSSNRYPPKYHVFLSFRGEDVRDKFLAHLDRALRQKEISTFKDDDKLKGGEDIKDGLYKSIEDSVSSIVILSVNYASSSWCLDELVHILCKRAAGHVIYPVFYHVTPSEVRKREGEFGEGFAKAAAANEGSVKKWTKALDEVAGLKGWAYPHTRFENEPALIDNLVNRLVEDIPGLVVEKVEHIPGPVIADQSTASKNLMKVLDLVHNDSVNIIGVWGMGGVGKTTLVKNLNNMLETSKQFSIIMWATASKNADIRSIQSQLVERLNLEEKNRENKERTAARLHQRLKQEKRFLFILDDVWEDIDLDYLGLSGLDKGNKIILTTRSMDVCRQMKTDVEVRVDVLNEAESWQLFIQNAGPVASLEDIEPIAKEVNLECSGLPLAIIVVGASMRGKKTLSLWKDALNAFQKSVPYIQGIEDKVYRPLKWSCDLLYFRNMNIKSCFLYCCLYPEDSSIPVNDLVVSWIGEALVIDSDNYKDMVNTGISMVEYLKDSCLLEDGIREDTVKMHDVVRDVATWIASSLEDDCKTYVSSGSLESRFSEGVFQENNKRVFLMDTFVDGLPNCSNQYPQVLSLLLQGKFFSDIPEGFFLGLPGLRVLNLSKSNKFSTLRLPKFLGQLSELRALLVEGFGIHELPIVGDLHMLQALYCSYTRLHTLPDGMENLRSLRLLKTESDHIEDGVISKLTRLEILDMTGSQYMWDANGKRRTPFDELRCLNHLTFLSISFVMSFSSTTDFSWLTKVKRFNLSVGKHLRVQEKPYERTIGIFGAELRGVGFRSLLQTASRVVLDNCKQVERLWLDLDKGYCYAGLKSLEITEYCKWTFKPVSGVPSEIDILPNLEELILHNVSSVKSISQLMHGLGSRFLKLRIIRVTWCYDFSSLFGEQDMWQKLETLEVIECDRIKKLPFNNLSASSIKEIRGTRKWWNQLEWDDEDSKSSLQHYFKPVG